ncbi:MAG: serine O-acetyltransferase [Alphaproteobacteria bacterium]|nr:serine O-acetyltransferase [Alphaproteobacteria bacterium]
MALTAERMATCDPVWARMREDVAEQAAREPILASHLHATILRHERLEESLSYLLAQKLGGSDVSPMLLREVFEEALEADPTIGEAVRADLVAVLDRDPACRSYAQAFLFFKGFMALESQRVAHWLWKRGREPIALYLQSRMSQLFGVDVHPNARLGRGIMMDHATGIVIGETAVVEDNVSMLHGVTLGGTGKVGGDRHPKVRRDVLIGTGAKILGNIEVGAGSRVAAGSVVLKDVPAGCTVAGVPARVVGCAGCEHPAQAMDHRIDESGDPGSYQI